MHGYARAPQLSRALGRRMRMRARSTSLVFGVLAVMMSIGEARADGIDLYYAFTRVAPIGSRWSLLLLVPAVMLVNYGLNLLVVGWPVIHDTRCPVRSVAVPLVGFTILGQLADRLGFIVAAISGDLLAELLGLRGEGAFLIPMVVLSFVSTGLFVAGLAFYYLYRRWHLGRGRSIAIAAAAGLLTNPAWVMLQLWRFK